MAHHWRPWRRVRPEPVPDVESLPCAVCGGELIAGPDPTSMICTTCGVTAELIWRRAEVVTDDAGNTVVPLGECPHCHSGQVRVEMQPDPDAGEPPVGLPAFLVGRRPVLICSECDLQAPGTIDGPGD